MCKCLTNACTPIPAAFAFEKFVRSSKFWCGWDAMCEVAGTGEAKRYMKPPAGSSFLGGCRSLISFYFLPILLIFPNNDVFGEYLYI